MGRGRGRGRYRRRKMEGQKQQVRDRGKINRTTNGGTREKKNDYYFKFFCEK
jgi:hypothetical protein